LRSGTIIYPVVNVKDGVVESISVDMGVPLLARKDIPFAPDDGPEPVVNAPVTVDGKVYLVTALSTGNPHGVIFVDDVWKVDLEDVGPKLERHPAFPRKANIEFAKVPLQDPYRYEGVGEGIGDHDGLGTGACAVMVAAALNGYTEKDIPGDRAPAGRPPHHRVEERRPSMDDRAPRKSTGGFYIYEP
jgi:diaminopimelate epimerase